MDNFRWAGVPFYIRTGKRLPVKATEIVVEFKNVPDGVYYTTQNKLEPNLLVFRVSPEEGLYFKVNAKNPDSNPSATQIIPVAMDISHNCLVGPNTTEGYELLLSDVACGDTSCFTRWEEVALAWSFVDKIIEVWAADQHKSKLYPAGSWGPEEAQQLLADDGFHWWPVTGQLVKEDAGE